MRDRAPYLTVSRPARDGRRFIATARRFVCVVGAGSEILVTIPDGADTVSLCSRYPRTFTETELGTELTRCIRVTIAARAAAQNPAKRNPS